MMFPKGESLEFEVTENAIWIKDDLIASIPFEVLKDDSTLNRERKEAEERVFMVFVKKNEMPQKMLDSISSYNKDLLRLTSELSFLPQEEFNNPTFLSDNSFRVFVDLRKNENFLSDVPAPSLGTLLSISEEIIRRIYRRGMLSIDMDLIDKDTISLRDGKFERQVQKITFFDPDDVDTFVDNYINSRTNLTPELYAAFNEYLQNFIVPNIRFNLEMTEEARTLARDRVPRSIGIVNENERIVAKHDRITKEIKMKINSYRLAKGIESGYLDQILQNIGKFLHIILILVMYIIYIYLFRKKIYNDNQKILMILIIILIISFLSFLVRKIEVNSPIEMLVVVPTASMLLTIIFDSRVGFYGTIVVALITGGLQGNDYVFSVSNIVAGALAAYTVRDIKNRTQIFRSFLFIFIAYTTSIIAFGLESLSTTEQMLIKASFGASNALISPVLTYGLIIFFERAFKITTDLTLLELTDFNRPLLKELSRSAPGTFTHSMTLGSMVESAAEAIEANPTLARVGAYYHDIGKTLKPDNFVENQMSNENPHEKLDPEESAKVIIDHVRKGVELAEKHKLPKEIIDFIPMHHGTMKVSFFYEKAKELYGAENVKEEDYRYPGPKPDTPETALLMLADACESTVKSMTDPDYKKVENIINNLIRIRIDDGQLDNAPITLGDLDKIKQTFLNTLIGTHHKRIRYPDQDELESKSDKNDD
jgi:putative nucleotidyltransferase with HDIG domain